MRAYIGLTIGFVACLAIAGLVVLGMFADEYWCADRWPWWGPPRNPDSTCSGHAWANEHPDDYPWNLPR